MSKTFMILFLVFLCVGCEDCSKPKKEICVEESCEMIPFFNPCLKIITPMEVCECLKYEEVINECYFTKEIK